MVILLSFLNVWYKRLQRLNNEKNNGTCVLELVKNKLANSIHDVSSGGLIVALAEMTIGSEHGVKINKPKKLSNLYQYFFGEDQSRYIIEIDNSNYSKVETILKENDIYFENIGTTQKDFFEVGKDLKIKVKDMYDINNRWYKEFNGIKN